MPGALLVRLRAGLRRKKKKKVRKSNKTRKITSKRQKERKTGSLPGSDRNLTPVPLPGVGLAAAILLGALGGGASLEPALGAGALFFCPRETKLSRNSWPTSACRGTARSTTWRLAMAERRSTEKRCIRKRMNKIPQG
jgi:hypothetical protein